MPDGESDANLRVPRFDTVLRGYNPRQVNERVTRLSFDLSHVTKSRDEAVSKVAELTKALGSAQQQLQDSREQLHRITVNPTSTEAMSERQRLMWQLAEEEIAEFKRDADNYDPRTTTRRRRGARPTSTRPRSARTPTRTWPRRSPRPTSTRRA
jgi:hypothetical protein